MSDVSHSTLKVDGCLADAQLVARMSIRMAWLLTQRVAPCPPVVRSPLCKGRCTVCRERYNAAVQVAVENCDHRKRKTVNVIKVRDDHITSAQRRYATLFALPVLYARYVPQRPLWYFWPDDAGHTRRGSATYPWLDRGRVFRLLSRSVSRY